MATHSGSKSHKQFTKASDSEPTKRNDSMSNRLTTRATTYAPTARPAPGLLLQRKCAACGNHTVAGGSCSNCAKDKDKLQRRASGFEASAEIPPIVDDVLSQPGQQLDTATRAFMESRFHHDFSGVRVHTGAQAAESAQSVHAQAYTVGSHIVFNTGQYAPGTKPGANLLAHELTHVLQQEQGLTRSAAPGIGPVNDEHERQADAVAHAIVNTPAKPANHVRPLIPGTHHVVSGSDGPPVLRRRLQRKPEEDLKEEESAQFTKKENVEIGACPKVPTKLGDKIPSPMCPTATHTGADEVKRFNFCLDSDQLTNPAQLGGVDAVVNSVPVATRFLIHGYASPEGQKTYNFRLACHRALKVADAFRQALRKRLKAPNERMLNAEVESRIETASQGPTKQFGDAESNRVAIVFAQVPGTIAKEPGCDDAPRNIGDIKPEIGCDAPKTLLDHTADNPQLARFHFCLDSDALTEKDAGGIRSFAHRQAAAATFVVHGFASVEGPPDYNQRLSYHRAVRIYRELINAGVLAERIVEVSGMGETDMFGETEQNRVAVVSAEGGELKPIPGGKRRTSNLEEKEAIRDEARNRVLSGKYQLAADAYISYWTCGRTPTVRQAVKRLTIRVPANDSDNNVRDEANGSEENIGVNVVMLSNVALRADNAIECVMGRIVDMAFHQAMLGHGDLPAGDTAGRHQAGLYLIHLAGLSGCQGPKATPQVFMGKAIGIDQPVTTDPQKNSAPPACAVTPQQTRFHPPAAGAKDRRETTFEVTRPLTFTANRGKLLTNFDDLGDQRSRQRVETRPEGGLFKVAAELQAKGEPQTFQDYEAGIIQTIVSDDARAGYDSGHFVEQELPEPVRMAHMRGYPMVAPPWTTLNSMKRPEANGSVSIIATGSGLNTNAALGLKQVDGWLPNSGLHFFTQTTHVSLWLVVRRLGAPLDRFAIRFIDGLGYDVVQTYRLAHRRIKGDLDIPVNVVGAEVEKVVLIGNFVTSATGDPSDPSLARFTTPVASQIPWRNQVRRVTEPRQPTRDDLTFLELKEVVEDILDNLVLFDDEASVTQGKPGTEMPRLGFDYIFLDITLPMLRSTGRLVNPEGETNVVQVEGPGLGFNAKKAIAAALEYRIRDRAQRGQDVVVRRDVIPGNELEPVGKVFIRVPPLTRKSDDQRPESDLSKRQEVVDDMAEAWACTLATDQIIDFFGAREFGRSYAMDRDRRLYPEPSDRLQMGEESLELDSHKMRLPCSEISAGVAVGGFHTHPNPRIPPVPSSDDEEEDDLDWARKCGSQAYIVTDYKAFRYFVDGSVDPNPTQLPKVTTCDAKHLQDNNIVNPDKQD
jgi:outer membrane protein OmpA-like peptidoglycan-associated protein